MGDGTEPTGAAVCASCVSLHGSAKSERWYRWLCTMHPAEPVYNPVTGTAQADPPFRFCRYVNDGTCADYVNGPNILAPKL